MMGFMCALPTAQQRRRLALLLGRAQHLIHHKVQHLRTVIILHAMLMCCSVRTCACVHVCVCMLACLHACSAAPAPAIA